MSEGRARRRARRRTTPGPIVAALVIAAALVAAVATLVAAVAGSAIPAGARVTARPAGAGPGGAASALPGSPAPGPTIELDGQDAAAPTGGTWQVRLALSRMPADATVQLVVHARVTTPAQLRATYGEDPELGDAIFRDPARRVDTLPTDPTGDKVTGLVLQGEGEAVPGAVDLSAGRTYPVEVVARDGAGTVLDRLVTYLVVLPERDDSADPLDVTVIADLRATPVLRPDGTSALTDAQLARLVAAAEALAAGDAPATLALSPELVDALAADRRSGAPRALAALRSAAGAPGRQVLAAPYVDVDPSELAAATLDDQLALQVLRGGAVLAAELGVDPTPGTWMLDRGLDRAGARLLAGARTARVVLAAGALADPDDRTDVTATLDGLDDAVAVTPDPRLAAVLGDEAAGPVVAAQRVAAELAVRWRQRPTEPGGVVVVVDPRGRAEAVRALLDHLAMAGMVQPTALDATLDSMRAAQPRRPATIETATPADPTLGPALAEALRTTGRDLLGFAAMAGPDSARAEPASRQLLVAEAAGLPSDRRRAHLASAVDTVRAALGAVSLPTGARVTLTARTGTVPVTITRTGDIPLTVSISLSSPKLEFPDGAIVTRTLEDETTRLDVRVRTLASGAFPLDVEIRSPDGSLLVAQTRYTVQSTAVSGVGLVLSVGAGLFLAGWWGLHWRRTRRSRRLVPRHAVR